MKKRLSILLSLLFVVAIVIGCSGGQSDGKNNDANNARNNNGNGGDNVTDSGKEKILLVAADQDPSGLDPHTTTASSSHRVMNKIYEALLDLDDDRNFVGKLAEDWKQVDETTYHFKLKEGVKFHNGREMVAEDVKYSFDRILDPDTGAISASYFQAVEEVVVLSDYEVEFKLSRPYAPFLAYVASGANVAIVPKEAVEEHGDLNQVAVGTGPFMLEEMISDTHVYLKSNKDYHVEGKPVVDGLKYLTMVDESSRLAAIRTGEVHLTTVTPDSVPLVEGADGIEVISYDDLEYYYLGFNVTREPWDKKEVRQAISLVVDRQEIIDTVMAGEAKLSGPVPESLGNWSIDVSGHELYQPNVEKAKKLLEEAGFADGFDMEIGVPSTESTLVSAAQIIDQQLAQIGINATIVQLEWGQYIDAWSDNTYDSLVGKNGPGRDPDRSLGFFFATNGSANVWGYSNPDYDEIIDRGLTEVDAEKRHDIYVEAQELLLEESPNLFLLMPKNYIVVRDNISGYAPVPHNSENFLDLIIE